MNFSGIIVGAAVFLIIGICHPIVIKMEFYWGKKSWWVLALAGVVFSVCSLFMGSVCVFMLLGHTRNTFAGNAGAAWMVPRKPGQARLL